MWNKYISHNAIEREPRSASLHQLIVVNPSDRVKPELTLKKWTSANVGLFGVKVDGVYKQIRQEHFDKLSASLERPYFDVLDYEVVWE